METPACFLIGAHLGLLVNQHKPTSRSLGSCHHTHLLFRSFSMACRCWATHLSMFARSEAAQLSTSCRLAFNCHPQPSQQRKHHPPLAIHLQLPHGWREGAAPHLLILLLEVLLTHLLLQSLPALLSPCGSQHPLLLTLGNLCLQLGHLGFERLLQSLAFPLTRLASRGPL